MDATRARVSALQTEWQQNKSDLAPQRAFQTVDEVLRIMEAQPEQWTGEADVFVELIEMHSEALRPLFPRLIAAGLDYPPFIWSGASEVESESLIRAIDQGQADLGRTLQTLAWIGDQAAVEAFARWKRDPPPNDDELFIPAAEYSREAAWYLDENDRKQELFARHCFAIELDETGANAPLFGDELPPCSWCASPLSELLRIDLTAPAMSWIGWPGSVLRVPMCPRCGYFEMGFARLNPDKPFEWWFDFDPHLASLVAKDEFVLQPDNKLGGPVARCPSTSARGAIRCGAVVSTISPHCQNWAATRCGFGAIGATHPAPTARARCAFWPRSPMAAADCSTFSTAPLARRPPRIIKSVSQPNPCRRKNASHPLAFFCLLRLPLEPRYNFS